MFEKRTGSGVSISARHLNRIDVFVYNRNKVRMVRRTGLKEKSKRRIRY